MNYLGGYIEIWANDILTSLSGLNGLTEIGGNLIIDNYTLPNLAGLESLTNIGGYLEIKDNIYITDLTGLNGLESVGDNITIEGNDEMTSLTGLESVNFLGRDLALYYNYSLVDLTALENLTQIGEDLFIGYNSILTSLNGLNNVTSIDGIILIEENPQLSTINALSNIDNNAILDLHIYGNNNLSDCDVQSICEYLVSPNGIVDIHDNAPGCNSQAEVEEACLTSVDENITKEEITIFPNPATDFITINIKEGIKIEEVIIYNHLGQKALVAVPVNNTLDVSKLKPGIYFLEVITSESRIRTKIVIE